MDDLTILEEISVPTRIPAADRADQALRWAAGRLDLAREAYATAVEWAAGSPQDACLPGTQFAVARMRGSVDTMTSLLARQRLRATAAGGSLAEASVAVMVLAEESEAVVSAAIDLVGDAVAGPADQLRRIWHDLKAEPAPVPNALARELVGKAAFGIDPDTRPRWL